MKMIRPVVLGIIVIALAGGLAWSGSSTTKIPPVPTPIDTSSTSGGTYTLADVSKHSDIASCWTTINSSVYNLTDWVSKHPGGREAILSICGKDGSGAFNAQHGGAQLQQEILKGYKLGTLSK